VRLHSVLLILAFGACAGAQDHVAWSVQAEHSASPGGIAVLRASARIEPGWHLYSASSSAGIPTTFQVQPGDSLRVFEPPPKKSFDKNLNAESETYQGEVAFILDVGLPAATPPGPAELAVSVRYETCNDSQCVPGRWSGAAAITVDPVEPFVTFAQSLGGYSEVKPPKAASGADSATPANQAWAMFLLVAFGFGLASIFTPCVFPMIPITMSYFLNRPSGGRRDGLAEALVFCLGIVVLFSGLGILATAFLGPFGVAQLGANRWINGCIAGLFIAFGLSLLGAFEITIPSSVLTRLNRASDSGGFAGALLMGLTFSLASFACVGPFVGTLLAASVSGGGARPLAGMVTFAAGLALPFFFLALFPAYLKRMPKAGGWMVRVKVVMGFVILAASLKYLSVVDQTMQWGFLTRERFLAAWIVLFAMAGLYLLGFLRLEGVKPDEPVGLGRLLTGIAFLVFAVSLLPGMFGGRLGELDAYVPEASAPGGAPSASALAWIENDYRGALDRARREGKLVFVNFTGYACANCHWMKANMFSRPEIAATLRNFVLVELYTDGTDAASESNAQLELAKFQTAAIPFYAILDPDERVIATFAGATRDPQTYLAFLEKAGQPRVPETAPASAPAGAQPGAGIPQVKKLDGGAFDTASLGGKVVVVNFWATWCAPCIQEIPGFNQLHRQFGSKGVVVLGVSMDEDGAAGVAPFLKKHPMDYMVALGPQELNSRYNLESLPVTLVFDRAGNQIKRFEGFTEEAALEAAVQQAL
jgi:thiol:disulfide interchange protein DsbD